MLCNALMQAMDNCRFIFFLNTPNSITPESAHNNPQTYSPWLFYELSVLKYIQKESDRIRKSFPRGRENFAEDVQNIMSYMAMNLENLPCLEFSDLMGLSKLYEVMRLETSFSRLGV